MNAVALANWVPAGRGLHLIDVENLLGRQPREASWHDFAATAIKYSASVPVLADDHLVVGCDWMNAFEARDAFPHALVVPGRGPDGGEDAILRRVDPTDVSRRFDRVVIGSGDHAFAALAADLTARCVPLTVVAAAPRALSARLASALGSDRQICFLDGSLVPLRGTGV